MLRWIGEDPQGEALPEEPPRRVQTFSLGEDDPAEEAVPPDEGSFAPQTAKTAWTELSEARLSEVRPTRRGRLALFTDSGGGEQFLFSVDEETAARLHLAAGRVLNRAELEEARSQSDLRAAKDKALQLLSARGHAGAELYRKLCVRFDEPTAAAAVAEMCRLGLVDDAAWAERRAAQLAERGKSRREIERVLEQAGIGREQRAAALEALPADEQEKLARLIERQYRAKLAAGRRDAVAAALLRRGFSSGQVRRALQHYDENAGDAGTDE